MSGVTWVEGVSQMGGVTGVTFSAPRLCCCSELCVVKDCSSQRNSVTHPDLSLEIHILKRFRKSWTRKSRLLSRAKHDSSCEVEMMTARRSEQFDPCKSPPFRWALGLSFSCCELCLRVNVMSAPLSQGK